MRIFRMNRKAISPIFATLILIAIAVIAGVVVYGFTAGWLGGMTQNTNAAQERLTVSGASFDAGKITVYVQDMQSTGSVTITGLLVKDSSGTITQASTLTSSSTSVTVTNGQITLDQSAGLVDISGDATIANAGVYTVTVTTSNGGQFVSPSFTV